MNSTQDIRMEGVRGGLTRQARPNLLWCPSSRTTPPWCPRSRSTSGSHSWDRTSGSWNARSSPSGRRRWCGPDDVKMFIASQSSSVKTNILLLSFIQHALLLAIFTQAMTTALVTQQAEVIDVPCRWWACRSWLCCFCEHSQSVAGILRCRPVRPHIRSQTPPSQKQPQHQAQSGNHQPLLGKSYESMKRFEMVARQQRMRIICEAMRNEEQPRGKIERKQCHFHHTKV